MFGVKSEKVIDNRTYLEKLSSNELKDHMFIGYRFKIVMTSGKEYTTPFFYIRGYHNDNYFIETLRYKRYCLTENNIELDTKYIESVEELEKTKPVVIGKKGFNATLDKTFHSPFIAYILEPELNALLALDNQETKDFEIDL